MAEDAHVLRGINWRETFPFTHIFRSFRVAIHPSKLILALLALLSLYAGGRVLDGLWPAQDRAVALEPRVRGAGEVAPPSEVALYASTIAHAQTRTFAEERASERSQVEHDFASTWLQKTWDKPGDEIQKDPNTALEWAKTGKGLGEVKDHILAERDAKLHDGEESYKKAKADVAQIKDDAARQETDKKLDEDWSTNRLLIYKNASDDYQHAKLVEGQGLFEQFFDYEVSQVYGVINGVVADNWLGVGHEGPGVIVSIYGFFAVGPLWLVNAHPLYFVIFALFFLTVWSIFGGAICRIAAVHMARDEKLSLRHAIKFSVSKFLSFIFAPIIPLVIVAVVGLVVLVGGLIGNVPAVGPIIISLFFFMALGAGFVMTLVLLGTIGGFNLMYPTIAVEGSDSFDAISRSFSYVYARPWRMLFYTLVAIVYGALTYLFVKLFITLMLWLTHYFVGKGMYSSARDGQRLWDALWLGPTWNALVYDVDFLSLSGPAKIAAGILSFWVYLAVSMLGAYAISFYFSSSTIIYYLMRREVDATELDDVYLEQSDEEFDTAPTAPGAGVTVPLTSGGAALTDAPPVIAAPVVEAPAGPAPVVPQNPPA